MIFGEEDMIKQLKNPNKIFPNLFKLLNNNFTYEIKAIKKLDEYFDLIEDSSEDIQKLFISKVILYLINEFRKDETNEEIDIMEKKYIKIIDDIEYKFNNISDDEENKYNNKSDDLNINDKILCNIKKFKEKNLDEIIFNIVKYLIEEVFKKSSTLDKFKKNWKNVNLNLKNFEINENMKKKFESFFENKENKEYFKDLKFSEKEPKMKEIYEHIKYIFKSHKYSKYKINEEECSLKELGDKERSRVDYGEYLLQEIKDDKIIDNKISKDKIMLVLEKLIIEMDFTQKECIYIYKYGKKCEIFDIEYFENAIYDENKIEEKIFKKYLFFIDKLKKYVNQIINKIKCKKIVTLEIAHKNGNQNNDDNILSLKDVRCISYVDKNFLYLDENILEEGISSTKPGLIFLLNELCNDDYLEIQNDEK